MLIHFASLLIANPVTTLARIPIFAFLPVVGVMMIVTVLSDRATIPQVRAF